MQRNHVFFNAYAKFPEGISAGAVYNQLTMGVLIDVTTDKVLDVSCTLVTELARNCVKSYLVDRNFKDELDQIVADIAFCHQGSAAKSLMKAVRDLHRKYMQFLVDNATEVAAMKAAMHH